MQERRAVYVEAEKNSKLREADLAGKLAVTQARLCEFEVEAARTKEEQLGAVLADSHAVSIPCQVADLVFMYQLGRSRMYLELHYSSRSALYLCVPHCVTSPAFEDGSCCVYFTLT